MAYDLQKLHDEEESYRASKSVRDELTRVTFICLVGAVGVGKNFLMQQSGLPAARRVTSRPPRPDDDPRVYTYVTNDEMAEKIAHKQVVQYAVDMRNQTIYGSMPGDYATDTPTLGDIWSWSVWPLAEKGFGAVKAVSVLAPLRQWREQLEVRFAGRDDAYKKARLEEAVDSLTWTKAQIDSGRDDHIVIVNDRNDTPRSVRTLLDFSHDKVTVAPPREETTKLLDDLMRFAREGVE